MNIELVDWFVNGLIENNRFSFYVDNKVTTLSTGAITQLKEFKQQIVTELPFKVSIGYMNKENPGLINISVPKPVYSHTEDDIYVLLYPVRVKHTRPYKYAYNVEIYDLKENKEYPDFKYRFNWHLVESCGIPELHDLDNHKDNQIAIGINSLINAVKAKYNA